MSVVSKQLKKAFIIFMLNVYLVLHRINTCVCSIVKGLMWNTVTKITEYDTASNTVKTKFNIMNPLDWFIDPYSFAGEYSIYETEKGFAKYNLTYDSPYFKHIYLSGDDLMYASFENESIDVSPFINKYKGCLAKFKFNDVIRVMCMQKVIHPNQYDTMLHKSETQMIFMTVSEELEKTYKGEDYFII
jgi:hypothetical protein